MVSEENQEDNFEGISPEDAVIAVQVVRKALEFRPFIKEGIFGEKWMELSKSQQTEEFLNPRISIFYPSGDRKIQGIYLRVLGEESPVAEIFFYPIEAAWSYLDEARQYVDYYRPKDWDGDQVESRAFDFAVDMVLMMIDNLYERSRLTTFSITLETIAQWRLERKGEMDQFHAERGEKVVKQKDRELEETLKDHLSDIRQMWKHQGQSLDNWKKIRFVDEYETLSKHWRWLLKMVALEDGNWRRYAKADGFEDTPDDLLDKIWDVDRGTDDAQGQRLSEISLEHAARRVGLIKKVGVSSWARERRKAGVKVSDYSSTQLFTFLKEGREHKDVREEGKRVQERLATYPTPESDLDAAQEEKRKSFERKIEFIEENSDDPPESDDDSAMAKKA